MPGITSRSLKPRLRLNRGDDVAELINLGLPSETCSGLSEPDHPFPRPDVHERLDRVLTKAKPDLVVACYGMNDGIYFPFSEERFGEYKRGINRIIETVTDRGARLILMTPPPFDPLPFRQQGKLLPDGQEKYAWFAIYENYDDVIRRYAAWILEQSEHVEMVIDLHGPMEHFMNEKRKTDPNFVMSNDGVHLNAAGHRILARAILDAWDVKGDQTPSDRLIELIGQRQELLHAAWLSHVGHKRPGVKAGSPLLEANQVAAKIEVEISKLSPVR